jgi:hypothetical protein
VVNEGANVSEELRRFGDSNQGVETSLYALDDPKSVNGREAIAQKVLYSDRSVFAPGLHFAALSDLRRSRLLDWRFHRCSKN